MLRRSYRCEDLCEYIRCCAIKLGTELAETHRYFSSQTIVVMFWYMSYRYLLLRRFEDVARFMHHVAP